MWNTALKHKVYFIRLFKLLINQSRLCQNKLSQLKIKNTNISIKLYQNLQKQGFILCDKHKLVDIEYYKDTLQNKNAF